MAKKKTQKQTQKQFTPERYFQEKVRQLPIYKCYKATHGTVGNFMIVIVSRQHPMGTVSFSTFVIDRLCKGVVHSTYGFNMDERDLQEIVQNAKEYGLTPEEVTYNEAHNWIYGAHDWAMDVDIKPGEDWNIAKCILEPDDENIPLIEYEFGEDGQYVLVAESMYEASKYMPALNKALGPTGYKFVMEKSHGFYDDDDDFDDDFDDDDFDDDDFDDDDFDFNSLDDDDFRYHGECEMEYTYAGKDYPQTKNIENTRALDIIEKKTEDISAEDLKFIDTVPADELRAIIHSRIMYELGVQWGKTDELWDEDSDANEFVIGNGFTLLTKVANEDSLEVVLEVLRQNYDFLEFNIGDWFDHFVFPILFVCIKDNPYRLKDFFLEEGLTERAKYSVAEFLCHAVNTDRSLKDGITKLVAEVLDAYHKDGDDFTITTPTVNAFMIAVTKAVQATILLPLVENLYNDDLVDAQVFGDYEDFYDDFGFGYAHWEEISLDIEECFQRYRKIIERNSNIED